MTSSETTFNDEELIARLRSSRAVWENGRSHPTEDETAAADRIEALSKACTEWAEVSQSNYQRAKAAEAKLAENEVRLRKAVEALSAVLRYVPDSIVECRGDKCRETWCASCFGWDDAEKGIETAYEAKNKALATIAEIKLQSSEFATQKGESHD